MPLMVHTVHSGIITVQDQDIITFPSGIIGFEGITQFCILKHNPSTGLYVLHSCMDNLAFAILDCRALAFSYNVQVELGDLIDLDVQRGDTLHTFVVVNRTGMAGQTTMNLLAPIVINRRSCLGKQVVQWYAPYKTEHPTTGQIKPIADLQVAPSAPNDAGVTVILP